ncbi:MAG: starch-binding protein [Ruminococcus sp.]|nr:starch-binding protein [Ruminococcus sp.]
MKLLIKPVSVLLSLIMIFGMFAVIPFSTASAVAYETYAQDTIQGGAILHCFNWSYNNIKANLADIAKAGYTAVQTSPVQAPKEYNASWTDSGNWYKLYQPLGLSIAGDGTTWLGTKAQLTSLCNEAEKYGIKVIVDIVANHLANNGNDGGTYHYLNSNVESDLKNASYYHTNNIRTNENNRFNITQYHLGMPDLNTANSYVQQRTLGLLEECIDCGVDGFRFDAAKHIETPADSSNFASQFWPTVINGAKEYAENEGYDEPFFYGEILKSAGPNFDISNYTTYMSVTDNETGDRALSKANSKAAAELADASYIKGASSEKSILWVESHDTYMGDSGSAGISNTKNITSNVINKAWAIVGARADSTSLFFARPNNIMGEASTDTNWKSTVVSEVNKFKNHFEGASEHLSSDGNVAYIERGTKGIVISKLDGGGAVELPVTSMQDGSYIDQITYNTFTVSNGVISGTVGSDGVAVVYNTENEAPSYITSSKLFLNPNANWTSESASFAIYVYNSNTNNNAWAGMTSADSGYYSANVPTGKWTNVIFCRMNPGNSVNSWDNVLNQTNDLFPDSGTNCYTLDSEALSYGNGSWSSYVVEEPTVPVKDTYTIYAINNAGWDNVNIYWWGSSTSCPSEFPGTEMTSVSGTKVYKYEIPEDVDGFLFTNGSSSSTKQSVDITSGISDGAVWTINSTMSSGKYTVSTPPDYYLVGTMNSWMKNDSYKFSITSSDSGMVEYKLSGVQLAAGAELKVRSSDDSWYPSGNNYAVSAAGTYDIYFRPNGDGGSDWHENTLYVKNVTPCTVTWKDSGGNTLKTETVTFGDTPEYKGETPTKAEDEDFTYIFSGWTPAVAAVTGDTSYTASFNAVAKFKTINYKYNIFDESTQSKVQKTVTKNISYMNKTAEQLIELNMPYIKNAYLEYGDYVYTVDGTTLDVTVSDTEKKYSVTLDGNKDGEYSYLETATLTSDEEKAFVVDGKVMFVGTSYSFYVCNDIDVTLTDAAEKAEYADIDLSTITIADGKVTLDMLATANVDNDKFKRMGVAFALSEKTPDEISDAVEDVATGTGTSNKIAVHNSTVDYANQSGQYQFRYAPYFSLSSALDRTIYFYTYVVDKNGNVRVSDAAQYNMSNLLA